MLSRSNSAMVSHCFVLRNNLFRNNNLFLNCFSWIYSAAEKTHVEMESQNACPTNRTAQRLERQGVMSQRNSVDHETFTGFIELSGRWGKWYRCFSLACAANYVRLHFQAERVFKTPRKCSISRVQKEQNCENIFASSVQAEGREAGRQVKTHE